MYTELTAGAKTYKLRLSTKNVTLLEKKLGCNPLGIFKGEDQLPTITEMVTVLFYSLLQYQHGITLEDTYDIFDEYLTENTATDFIAVILEIYKASGLIKKENVDVKN